MFGDKLVDLVLGEVEGGYFAAHCLERVATRVSQCAQVGGIYLSVAAEAAEILINHSRIQKGIEPSGEIALQAVAIRVKVIQVVLKADPFSFDEVRVEHARHKVWRWKANMCLAMCWIASNPRLAF